MFTNLTVYETGNFQVLKHLLNRCVWKGQQSHQNFSFKSTISRGLKHLFVHLFGAQDTVSCKYVLQSQEAGEIGLNCTLLVAILVAHEVAERVGCVFLPLASSTPQQLHQCRNGPGIANGNLVLVVV